MHVRTLTTIIAIAILLCGCSNDQKSDMTTPVIRESSDWQNPISQRVSPDIATSPRCYSYGWAKTWGGSGWDYGQDVAVDHAGNIFVTGAFYDTVDFDPGPKTDYRTSTGIANIFLSKFDTIGNFKWVRTWGGPGFNGDHDYAAGVVVDNFGGVYVSGKFWGVADCDPSDDIDLHGTSNSTSHFISKFNSNGAYQWAQAWNMSVSVPYGLAICDKNTICLTGWFQGTKDFDPGPEVDNHTGSGYLSRFDINGDYLGACAWDGLGFSIAADNSDNIYVAGYFSDTVDFDPSDNIDLRTSNGDRDAYVSKFDVFGNYLWVRAWGGPEREGADGLAISSIGDVCVSGPFVGTVDFDPGAGIYEGDFSEGQNSYLSKFDALGNLQWAQTWTTGYFGDIAIDPEGFIYATDAKFTSSGEFQWMHTWGGYSSRSLAVDGLKAVYAIGGFLGVQDFAPHNLPCDSDPDLHDAGGSANSYLVKFLPDGCW